MSFSGSSTCLISGSMSLDYLIAPMTGGWPEDVHVVKIACTHS
jgi:hypothetical protein